MRVLANLDKGEVFKIIDGDGIMVADTGSLPVSHFDNLTDIDEIFKKSIEMGYVDHHVIDNLDIIQEKNIKCCSTLMATKYSEDVLKYINEHNIKDIYIHKETDLDAICSGWIIKHLGEKQKLPEIAKDVASIVNKVDYAVFRTKQPEDYAYSFPGCMRGIMNSVKYEKSNMLKNNSNYTYIDNRNRLNLTTEGRALVEMETNNEMLDILDIIEEEKHKNPDFDIGMRDFNSFLENNPKISPYIKAHLAFGVNRFMKDQDEFEASLKEAETLSFKMFNNKTKEVETKEILIFNSSSPLKTTNVAYNTFQDKIIAAYNPDKNIFAIGIAAESLKEFRPVMKQLCVKLNHIEEEKRNEIYGKKNKTREDVAFIKKIEGYPETEAFKGASELNLISKAPVPLVGGGALIVQSYCNTINSFDEFKDILRDFAKKTNSLEFNKNKSLDK